MSFEKIAEGSQESNKRIPLISPPCGSSSCQIGPVLRLLENTQSLSFALTRALTSVVVVMTPPGTPGVAMTVCSVCVPRGGSVVPQPVRRATVMARPGRTKRMVDMGSFEWASR